MFYVARNKQTKNLLLLPVPHSADKVYVVPVWTTAADADPYLKAMHIQDENIVEPFDPDEWRRMKNVLHASWTQLFLHLMETNGVPHGKGMES